jgi:hypothetical protein
MSYMGVPAPMQKERETNPPIPLSVDSTFGVLQNASILETALILTLPNAERHDFFYVRDLKYVNCNVRHCFVVRLDS